MKIQLILSFLLFILLVEGASGQDRTLSADSDTVFWHKYYAGVKNQLGVGPIDNVYFRFWTGESVIELRKVEGKIVGDVIFMVEQYKKKKPGKIYFERTSLTTECSNTIYTLVNKYAILELPTDSQIAGWQMGLDGITYIIEAADENSFSFKTYWTPTSYQDKLSEAKRMVDFIHEIEDIEGLKSTGIKFMGRQPFTTWYSHIGSNLVFSKARWFR